MLKGIRKITIKNESWLSIEECISRIEQIIRTDADYILDNRDVGCTFYISRACIGFFPAVDGEKDILDIRIIND